MKYEVRENAKTGKPETKGIMVKTFLTFGEADQYITNRKADNLYISVTNDKFNNVQVMRKGNK